MAIDAVPVRTRRKALMDRLAEPRQYDLAVIGGGATGLGVALDAAARGFSVVLVESHDFAKGTSSRATKLVHGGVRYLAQGNISLVREALHERSTLLAIAPHLAQPLPFVMPSYKFWESPFYGVGLKLYDALAGKDGLGDTEFLNRADTLARLPTLQPQGLKGGVKYWDGQFDDARLALALARTAARHGALLVNYCAATRLIHEDGKVTGLWVKDRETGHTHELHAGCVVNATGVWVDRLRLQDGQATGARPAHGRPQPGRTHRGGPRVPADRPRPADSQDRRRPRAVRRALAGQDHPGHHRHAAPRPGARTAAVPGRARLHPARVGPLPEPRARAGRHQEHLGRSAAAGQAAPKTTPSAPRRCRANTPCWSARAAWSP